MSDKERFLDLYRSLGIEPKAAPYHGYADDRFPPDMVSRCHEMLRLTEGDHPKLIGYGSMGSDIYFDEQGAFLAQGFWE